MQCPQCGLFNPSSAQRCDCGYDFVARTAATSYLDGSRWSVVRRSATARHRQAIVVRIFATLVGACLGSGVVWIAHGDWSESPNPFDWNTAAQRDFFLGAAMGAIVGLVLGLALTEIGRYRARAR